jgi:hypothetical protein
MQKPLLAVVLGISVLASTAPFAAETRVSGYGSFVAGKTISGQHFLSDYPKTGVYDRDWSFSPDTTIGIQLSHEIDQNYSFIVQLNAHGAREYETEINWAYINYQINTELSVQLGRKRLPLYYYSDFFDLGYAYNWIRPPADNYTWQISNFNGISLLYETHLGNWDASFNIYTGREDSQSNDLLSYLSADDVDETWKNIIGVVGDFTYSWLNIRLTAMSSELDRTINDMLATENMNQQFAGLSVNITRDNFSLLSEFNGYKRNDDDIDIRTRMLSLSYTINDVIPYISYSEFCQELTSAGGDENHTTRSAGIRWDIFRDTALKIQFDNIDDKGVGSPVLGDSEAIAIGIDVVF